jgi:hypothetical protein
MYFNYSFFHFSFLNPFFIFDFSLLVGDLARFLEHLGDSFDSWVLYSRRFFGFRQFWEDRAQESKESPRCSKKRAKSPTNNEKSKMKNGFKNEKWKNE